MTEEQIAYYTPQRFDGQELNVVINAGWMDKGEESTIEVLRRKFEELTGAKVNYIALPENEMYDKVRLELANNSGLYDMMHTGAGGAKEYGLSDYLIPLPMPPDIDDFYAADVAQYSIGGELLRPAADRRHEYPLSGARISSRQRDWTRPNPRKPMSSSANMRSSSPPMSTANTRARKASTPTTLTFTGQNSRVLPV